MAGAPAEVFSRHEGGHVVAHLHLGYGVGHVVARPGEPKGLVTGSASPAVHPAYFVDDAEAGTYHYTNALTRLVAGQVAEGLAFDERQESEGDMKNARVIARNHILDGDHPAEGELALSSPKRAQELDALIDDEIASAWERAAHIMDIRSEFLSKVSDVIQSGIRVPLDGKVLIGGLGGVWEEITGETLPADLKPEG